MNRANESEIGVWVEGSTLVHDAVLADDFDSVKTRCGLVGKLSWGFGQTHEETTCRRCKKVRSE